MLYSENRGMRLIVEVGGLPQSKHHGSTSTHNLTNKINNDCDNQSQCNVSSLSQLIAEVGCIVISVDGKFNIDFYKSAVKKSIALLNSSRSRLFQTRFDMSTCRLDV